MKTETSLTKAEHILEDAFYSLRNIYALPADDYLVIYGHLVKCMTHIKMRKAGKLPEHVYVSDELQP